jgi:hypothetical protein
VSECHTARRLRLAGVMAALTEAALLAAGCGSNTAGSTATSVSGTGQAMNAYARCVDNHGQFVSAQPFNHDSPNPPGDVPLVGGWTVVGGDPSSPGYLKAAQACAHLLPVGTPPSEAELHQQLASALKGAACIRAHGYPSFPDPTDQPGYIVWPLPGAGIDTSSPQFQSAKKACGVGPLPQQGPTPVTSAPQGAP